MAKSHRAFFPLSLNKNSTPFALIHSDVWGPSPITSVFEFKWFELFVDDSTCMTWLYLLKHKDKVLGVFKSFHVMVQTQFFAKIQVLRSDNGGEYVNHRFRKYFQQHGIIHETSYPKSLNKTKLLNRKTDMFLKLLELSYLVPMLPVGFGPTLLPLLFTCSTECPIRF